MKGNGVCIPCRVHISFLLTEASRMRDVFQDLDAIDFFQNYFCVSYTWLRVLSHVLWRDVGFPIQEAHLLASCGIGMESYGTAVLPSESMVWHIHGRFHTTLRSNSEQAPCQANANLMIRTQAQQRMMSNSKDFAAVTSTPYSPAKHSTTQKQPLPLLSSLSTSYVSTEDACFIFLRNSNSY